MTPASSPPATGRRVWLRLGHHRVELQQGEMLIGRSPDCQLVLQDPRVSRVHAKLVLTGEEATLEDLGSVNGVLVNGERLLARRVLALGDRVAIGDHSFELYATPRAPLSHGGQPQSPTRPQEPAGVTHSSLELLSGVVEKALSLGHGEEAERLLAGWLYGLLHGALVHDTVDLELAERAATYAIRLAETTKKGTWVEYIFNVYKVASRPPPAPLVDRLYKTVRVVTPIDRRVFRSYIEALRSKPERFGPTERFLIRRLEGLEAYVISR